MLKDTVNSSATMGKDDKLELSRAIGTLYTAESDFYDLIGIVSLMRDAILHPDDDESAIEISSETRRGFVALSAMVTAYYNTRASDVADVKRYLEKLQTRQKMAA